jgi:tetratricopeptide (TPR) repeat protein
MATSTGSGGAGSTRRGQWLLLGIIVATGALVRAQSKDVEYATTMQKGVQALAQGQNRAALDLFQKANALRDKKSPEAYFGIGKAYFGLRELESAVDGCTEGLKYSGVDKHVEASLHNLRGMSLIALGAQKNTQGRPAPRAPHVRARFHRADARRPAHLPPGLPGQGGATRLLGHLVRALPRIHTHAGGGEQEVGRPAVRHDRRRLRGEERKRVARLHRSEQDDLAAVSRHEPEGHDRIRRA